MLQLVPPNLVPPDHLWQLQLVPRTICGTADGPPGPTMQWRRGWSPFATAGLPYNPAFIAFLLKHIATLKVELKIAALHACQCT